MFIDYQFSADVFVADVHRQAGLMVDRLGLHPPGPKAISTGSPEANAIMLRMQRSFAPAPTRFEVIQPNQATGFWNCAHIQQAWSAQKDRPVRFHNTVYIADTDSLMEHWKTVGIPFVADDSLTFRRVWPGISPDEMTKYDPSFDAGLRTEFLPSTAFPVELLEGDPYEGDPLIRRVRSRSLLTNQVETDVRVLERLLKLEPVSVKEDARGDLRAIYEFTHPYGASLELVQPGSDTNAGKFLAWYGTGPYTISLEVRDVDAAREEVVSRGVTCSVEPGPDSTPVVCIEPGEVGDVRLELVGR